MPHEITRRRHHIPIAAPSTREPATGNEPYVRVSLGRVRAVRHRTGRRREHGTRPTREALPGCRSAYLGAAGSQPGAVPTPVDPTPSSSTFRKRQAVTTTNRRSVTAAIGTGISVAYRSASLQRSPPEDAHHRDGGDHAAPAESVYPSRVRLPPLRETGIQRIALPTASVAVPASRSSYAGAPRAPSGRR
jgi:hypothetical protein